MAEPPVQSSCVWGGSTLGKASACFLLVVVPLYAVRKQLVFRPGDTFEQIQVEFGLLLLFVLAYSVGLVGLGRAPGARGERAEALGDAVPPRGGPPAQTGRPLRRAAAPAPPARNGVQRQRCLGPPAPAPARQRCWGLDCAASAEQPSRATLAEQQRECGPEQGGIAAEGATFSERVRACTVRNDSSMALELLSELLEGGATCDPHMVVSGTAQKFFKLAAQSLDDARMQEIGLQLIQAMLDQDIVPTILIQNRLICAWRSKLPMHVLKFFMKLRDQGVNISPTAYRCIMCAHECVDPHLTLLLFDEMRTRGTKLDRVAFNAVLKSCCTLNRVDRALELYSQMPGHSLVPNGKTYGTLIKACTAVGKVEHALYLFDLMQKANLEPNRFAFNDAIQCCVKVKRLGKAVTLLRDMVQANALPLESSYKCLLRGCQSEGWVEVVPTIERHAIESRHMSLKSGKQLPPLGPLPGLDEVCRAERAKGCAQLVSGIASGPSDVSSQGPASSSYPSSSSSAADC